MPESINLTVLARYLDGTSSAEERATVEAWIGTDPRRRAAVADLHAAWSAEAVRLGAPYDVERAWASVVTRPSVEHPDGSTPLPRRAPLRASLWAGSNRGAWAAAAAVLAAAGGVGWFAVAGRQPPPVAQASAMREYATAPGQRAVVRLADGTEITLNVATRLRVPAEFGVGRREVYLEGEAYFSVIHDSLRPFAVHTRLGVTRDLGTKFAVGAYADEAAERIAVAEGAVTVGEMPVRAGEVATVSGAGQVSVLRSADLARELAWTHGRLQFDGVPLGDVARLLGRWYDLDVRVAGPELARRPVTGSYGSEPIGQVLTVITAAVGARYLRQGRTVTISAAERAPSPPAFRPSPS